MLFLDIYTINEDKQFNNNYISINGWALKKKCTVLTKPVFVDEIIWRQDYKRKNNKIELVYFFLLGVFIFRFKRLEDHYEKK